MMKLLRDNLPILVRCGMFAVFIYLGQQAGLGAALVAQVPALGIATLSSTVLAALHMLCLGSLFYVLLAHVWNRVSRGGEKGAGEPVVPKVLPTFIVTVLAVALGYSFSGWFGVLGPIVPASYLGSYVLYVVLADLPGALLVSIMDCRAARANLSDEPSMSSAWKESLYFRQLGAAFAAGIAGCLFLTATVFALFFVSGGVLNWQVLMLSFLAFGSWQLLITMCTPGLLVLGGWCLRFARWQHQKRRQRIFWSYFCSLAIWIVPLVVLNIIGKPLQTVLIMLGTGGLMLLQSAVSALVYQRLAPEDDLDRLQGTADVFA